MHGKIMKKKECEDMKTDILIVGSGCSGLYCALQLPREKKITIITKSNLENNDSYLAQGGICMLKDESDYEKYFEDTMKAGHYENDKKSVEIMIRSSQDVVKDLLSYGVEFQREKNGELAFTKEGAHSEKRILFHEDITGKEITSKLYERVKEMPNVTLMEYTTLVDLICEENNCYGAILRAENGDICEINAEQVVLATGGVGGLYHHSTNYRHLTGDALAIAVKHNIQLKDVDYVQIHPTTLYTKEKEERSFLISESVRGEGAKLYDKNMKRFVNELLPRDLLTEAIHKKMAEDGTEFVWEDLRTIPKEELERHFPNIVAHCLEKGYDVTKECIPVVPAQHYFMGGIRVNYQSKTSMEGVYAVGETACNGVHGKNRLASNSLLESLVFAKRAAKDIAKQEKEITEQERVKAQKCYLELLKKIDLEKYRDAESLEEEYREIVWAEIERSHEKSISA